MTLAPFIHIACQTLDPCTSSDALPAFATRYWMCSSCNTQLPGVAPIDVCIQETRIRHKFMSGADFLGLVHDDFLALFDGSLIQRDLMLGRVFTEKGRQLVGWHTLRARRCVIVRGSLRGAYRVTRRGMVHDPNLPGYRVCEECGRNIYYDEGKKYLYPDPPDDADLFETPNIGLVARARLLEHVDLSKFRKLSIEHLPVLDKPLDGLGVLNCVS